MYKVSFLLLSLEVMSGVSFVGKFGIVQQYVLMLCMSSTLIRCVLFYGIN